MTTRSSRLWAATSVIRGTQIVYTAPAGNTVILKSVFLALDTEGELTTVQIRNGSLVLDILRFTYLAGQTNLANYQGWVVLEPGDQVAVFTSVGTVRSWGSGAELPIPASLRQH